MLRQTWRAPFVFLSTTLVLGCLDAKSPLSTAPPREVVTTASSVLPPPAPSAAVTEVPRAEEPAPVRFLAVGDVMLSRKVAGRILEAGDPLLPFRGLAPLFESVDFTFANLEGPFSDHDTFANVDDPDISIFNVPRANVEGLVKYRFSLLNLANNHMMDQGPKGVAETRALLASRGLFFTGAGASLDEAWEPAVITVRGVRVALVGASYCSVNDMGQRKNPFVARIEDEPRLEAAIAKARSRADYVIATMHAGTQYVAEPTPSESRFAQAALRAGADIVIGGHPHVLQRVERTGGKLVFYSLGNFIFDHKPTATRQSVAIEIELSASEGERGKVRKVEVIPVFIDGVTPRAATETERRDVLAALGVESTVLAP